MKEWNEDDLIQAASEISAFMQTLGYIKWCDNIHREMDACVDVGMRTNPKDLTEKAAVQAASGFQAFEWAVNEFEKITKEAEEVANARLHRAED